MKKTLNAKSFISIFIFFAVSFSAFPQTWQIVTPKYATTDAIVAGYVVDAATYGNGTTDATAYIQGLLNNLDNYTGDNNHGGGVVYLPEGRYKISGRLNIPKGITLRGDWKKPVKGQPIVGTIIQVYDSRGVDLDANGNANSFITMESGAAVMDLAFWYPDQDPNNIVPYPPTIQFGKPSYFGDEFCNAKNVTLVNSYYGIIFYQGGGTCPTINGVYGTPLKQGVEIDRIVDIGRIEHCDFSPKYWAGSGLAGSPAITNTTYTNWIYNNGTGIVMRRNDWSYTTYLSVEGYNKGFHALQSRQMDNGNYATPNGHNYGWDLKNCKYGVYYESRASEGCMFTEVKTAGCEFGMYFTENAGGVAQLYKCQLSATKCAIYSDKNASTKITMQESTIKAGRVLLQGGTLAAVNNDFNNPQPQIQFEANSRGDIIGNRFAQTAQILENSVFVNKINHTPVTVEPLPAYREFIPQTKKPSRNVMYNVLSYGVTKGTRLAIPGADATAGIQNALNAASAAGGGIVYLPAGHYRINGQLTIPANVELKGAVDVAEFPMGPGSTLEIYNQTTPAVVMQASSGLRGVVFNYPTQVYCTVMPNPIDFPYTILGAGNNIYIVNVGMRAANRGVDLKTNRCDNFYIDFLTGYFFREGVNIKNSDNGILANMQCNTIVYNCGDETKFGSYPNSNRPSCSADATKDPYLYNSKNMNFLTLENTNNIFMYNDFNYNSLTGLTVKSNVNGVALGFALDDDRTALLLDGSNIDLDFINVQVVALQRGVPADGLSSYIKTTTNYTAESNVNLFNSDYWGYAGESGIVMDGAGTVNLQGANFQHSGANSFANVDAGHLNVIGSVVNNANSGVTYNGTATGNITTIGTVIDGNAVGTTNISHSPTASTSGALNDCNTWTATATYTNGGAPQNIVNCLTTDTWNSGWQSQDAGAGAVSVTVDMKANKTFNQVILDYGSAPNDGPETYVLEVSTNNTTWTQVATGSGRNTAMTMISFNVQTARYIRVTKPASTTANFWAINNIYVVNIAASDVNTIPAVSDGTPGIADGETTVSVISVSLTNATVNVGNTVTLVPVFNPTNATNQNVTFSIISGSDKISLNTSTGVVTGVAVGVAQVRVTTADGNKTADATITVNAAVQNCPTIRTIRIQSYDNGGTVTAINLRDNAGSLQWSATADDNAAWYEIPVDGSSTDFYFKNVGTGKYLYRANTGVLSTSCDWAWESALLNATNAKTDYYKFRESTSTWGGRYWLANVASADFVNLVNKGAFILSGINNNHTTCGMPTYPAAITGAIPNNTNVWTSVALAVVNAAAINPDCAAQTCDVTITTQPQGATYNVSVAPTALSVVAGGTGLSYIWYQSTDNSNSTVVNDTQVSTSASYSPSTATAGTYYYFVKITSATCSVLSNVATITVSGSVGTPTYPAGYPKTMAMQNPLFWQFPSPVLNADGSLKNDGSTGPLYTADASAHVWNINGEDVFFLYASHDMSPAAGCDRMDRYHVFSTTDMVNWTDYGEIMNADNIPWAPTANFKDNSKFMWAPDCAYKNGKYYYYFPHPSKNLDGVGNGWGDNWKIGVATSDFPASDFTVLSQPVAGLPDKGEIDPCVFVDDDNQAYFYYGGGGRCYAAKLKENMIELDGTLQEMQGLVDFHEATWIHKYNGKYYLSCSDNHGTDGNQMKYAISDSPLGPWTDMGVYMYATGCGTNHGSIVEYKGQWYAVYHTDYVSNSGEAGRSVHVDPLYYNADGSIQVVNTWGQTYNGTHTVLTTTNTTDIALNLQAEDFNTNSNGDGYGYHDLDKTAKAVYRPTLGMTIEARAGGVYNLGGLAQKEFLKYTINVQKAGLYDIDCYVASGNPDGKFHLSINGTNKSGTVSTPNTGGWGDAGFTKVTVANIPLKVGAQNLELRIENGGFNIDRFEFRKSAPYAGTPYNGPHNVYNGAVVQAEDFDNGGMGVAYYDNDATNNSGAYRTTEGVDLENSNGSIHISWSNGGEWSKYTINVTEQGTYEVQVPVATGNAAAGTLFFTIDDVYVYPIASINTGSWNTYQTLSVPGIVLTTGIHVLTLNIGGNINVDKFTFVKTSSDISVGIAKSKEVDVTVYPNPSDGIFNINMPQAGDMKIVDIKGSLVYVGKLSEDVNAVDISTYPSGMYFATVKFNNQIQRLKLVKK